MLEKAGFLENLVATHVIALVESWDFGLVLIE